MTRIENRDICKECGGYCCKKCGCDYFVSDIEDFKLESIENLLTNGNISIVAAFDFKYLPNGTLTALPFLYLRERNINRDIIDLFSMKTTCASLTENGCIHDLNNRPGGGASLIPKEDGGCVSSIDKLEELKKWKPYQKTLERIVKRHTGMSVQAKLKDDVEKLFIDILNENYDNVATAEKLDILKCFPLLQKAYAKEFKKVSDEFRKENPTKKLLIVK